MTFTVPNLSSKNDVSFTVEIIGMFPASIVEKVINDADTGFPEASSTVAPMPV